MTNLNATFRQTARTLAITLLLGASLFALPATAIEPEVQEVTQASTQASKPAAPADYAAREQQDAKLDGFQGGDTVVVVGGTTLVIVLLVILIVVII